MAAGAIVALNAQSDERDLQSDLGDALKNRPKYKINDEAYQNQAVARQLAYGRDAAIMGQEAAIEQDSADAMYNASNITSSASSLQATIAAIQAGKLSSRRDLATIEAQLMGQRKGQLINVNNQMIDEKDKAWNYNVNDPYQNRIAALREQIKHQQELEMAGLSYEAQTTSSMLGSIGSMGGA